MTASSSSYSVRAIDRRIMWPGRADLLFALILLYLSVASMMAPFTYASDSVSFEYAIMRPDQKTLQEWVSRYQNAQRVSVDRRATLTAGYPLAFSLLDHLQYTPSQRNQGYCGNCWAWAATGVMEVALDVQGVQKDRLSIQYLNSNYNGGTGAGFACCGGWLYHFSSFYSSEGLAVPWSNTNAAWSDIGRSCGSQTSVPASSISTSPHYSITSITDQVITTQGAVMETAISNIKYVLNQNRAVWFAFYLATQADWSAFGTFWATQPETAVWNMDAYSAHIADYGFGGHAVLVVGYDDSNPSNRYWIVLNSWGTTSGRPNGLFRLKMDINYDDYFYDPYPYGYYSLYWQTLDVSFAQQIAFQLGGVGSDAVGTLISIDGTGYAYSQYPLSFAWAPASTHTVVATDPVTAASGKQYRWASWTNGDGLSGVSGTYTTPTSPQTVTANYVTQYQLTIQASPSGGGTTNPAVGSYWYDSGTSVPVSATVASGYSFYYWSLDGTNVGTSPSYSALMNSAHILTAMFRSTSSVSVSMSVAPDGFAWIISGTITPTQPSPGILTGTPVALSYSSDSGGTWSNFITVLTSSAGDYSVYWQQPYQYADLRVRASWNGNAAYEGSTSSFQMVSGTYGPFYPPVSVLVSGSGSVARGGSATFDVIVTSPSSYTFDRTLYIIVVGPDGYQYIDTVRAAVNAGETKRYQFVWQAPSSLTTGTYQIYAGLIPPNPAALGQTQIAVT